MLNENTDKVKHSAAFYIKQIEENPEKYGVTKEHINKVNRMIKQAEIQMEKDMHLSERMKPGIIVRINGKLAKVIEHTDIEVTAETSKGSVLKADIDDITICRNQDKVHDLYTAECNKNTEKQIKKADREFKKENKVDISGW